MSQKKVRVPQQKRSIEKKEKIVTAAFQVFNKKGYFATYTDDIAEEAGLSVGCIYSYFHDKKDILLDCLNQSKKVLIGDMCNEIANVSGTGGIFKAVKNTLLILIKFHTDQTRLFHDEVNSLKYRDEDIRKYFVDTQKFMMETISKEIERHGYTFQHPQEQTFLLWQMVDSIQDELAFVKSPNINQDILIEDCARLIISMLIKVERH